jgi:dihydrofolate reductase
MTTAFRSLSSIDPPDFLWANELQPNKRSAMRKIITTTFVTLDGVMQGPGGPEEDTSNGFKWGGWSFPFWDDVGSKTMDGFMRLPFDLLLGRRTYDIFASYWPHVTNDPIADNFNRTHKYVASRQALKLDWANSSLVNSTSEIARLKKEKGNDLWVHGSGELIRSLLADKLVDAMYIWTCPVTLGGGKRLFEEGTHPQELKLLEQKTTTTGVVISKYEPHGEVRTGSFTLEERAGAEREKRK